jgi:hypothetical protein
LVPENIAFVKMCPWLRPSLRILANVAYRKDSGCICPYMAPELTVGSPAEAARRRAFNSRVSSNRQRVEPHSAVEACLPPAAD